MADDDKKRTQEASETNFTTRGGRQDERGHENEIELEGAVGTRTYAAL